MSPTCERVRADAGELVRAEPPAELEAHARECGECAAVLAGARALRRDLDGWSAPAPAADLVERTLASLAVRSLAAGGEPRGEVVPFPAGPATRRRSSVEILTEPPGAITSPVAPTRRQLAWRVVVQSAAAALLATVCIGLGAAGYPVVVEALEEGRMERCQERLHRVQAALVAYRAGHPDAAHPSGPELRAALIQGGYLDETELLCPAHQTPGASGYSLELPGVDEPGDPPVAWDQFRHHPGGINVIYRSGRAELVRAADLGTWARRLREPAGEDEPR